MSQGFYTWSKTAASNAGADSSINFAEGQAPSSVNDSARALMARAAEYRDDIAGAIVTGGTSTAYTVTSYEVFDTLAHLNGQMIAFSPNATNGATVTLNVDGLGAKPLRTSPNTELLAGVLIQGTPYVATYNNSDGAFYLQGFYGNPYNIPLGGSLQYWGSTTPNSSFAFMRGSTLSRTTYATLFALIGTTYGAGDGSTTFAIPDLRGRVPAGADDVGNANRLTSTYFGADSHTLGAVGGAENQNITQAQLPNVAPTFTGSSGAVSVTSTVSNVVQGVIAGTNLSTGTGQGTYTGTPVGSSAITSTGNFTPAGTIQSINGGVTQSGLRTVPPTIICNHIMRVA